MSNTKKYVSLPGLELAIDLAPGDMVLRSTTALDWYNQQLITTIFNTDYIPFTLISDSRTQIEFGLLTTASIVNIATTGATIYKRGLKEYAEGLVTDSDEVAANKLDWTSGETTIMLGTNPPWLYGRLANKENDEIILGHWTMTQSPAVGNIPPTDLIDAANLFSVSGWVDSIGTNGDILGWSGGVKAFIAPGAAGEVLTSNGAGVLPSYQALAANIEVKDEGVQITPTVSSFDFVGAGVTATAIGNAVTVTIPSAAPSAVEVDDEGVLLTANVAKIDFVGAGVTATAVGNDVTVTIPGGGGGSGKTTQVDIHQTGHGFSVGDVLRSSGVAGTYTKALADTATNAEAVGIVTVVLGVDDFTMVTEGYVDVAAAVPVKPAGTVLYLSDAVAGQLTDVAPTISGHVSKPMAVVETSNSTMIFRNYRGIILQSGAVGGASGSIQLTPHFTVGNNVSSILSSIGYSDETGQPIIIAVEGRDTGAAVNSRIYRQETTPSPTIFPYLSRYTSVAAHGFNTKSGVVLNGSNVWSNTMSFSPSMYKDTSLVTIVGGSNYGNLSIDSNNSYLLVQYDTTHIARYSGIAGTLITYVSTVTLDTPVEFSQCSSFIYDNTNQRYIFVDTVNHVVRRFNSTGTTIDTVAFPTPLTASIIGVCFIGDIVNIITATKLDDQVATPHQTDMCVSFIPTTMTR